MYDAAVRERFHPPAAATAERQAAGRLEPALEAPAAATRGLESLSHIPDPCRDEQHLILFALTKGRSRAHTDQTGAAAPRNNENNTTKIKMSETFEGC